MKPRGKYHAVEAVVERDPERTCVTTGARAACDRNARQTARVDLRTANLVRVVGSPGEPSRPATFTFRDVETNALVAPADVCAGCRRNTAR
jgi:outer membrane lipoprotein-sorting protein